MGEVHGAGVAARHDGRELDDHAGRTQDVRVKLRLAGTIAADGVDAETPAVASTARIGLPVSAGFAEREPGQDRGADERHGLRSVNVRHM